MPSEIDLLETENLGSIFTIAAFLIFILSALMAIRIKQTELNGVNLKFNPTPSEVTANGAWALVIGSLILFIVSIERIQQRKEQLQSGTSTGTLVPNLWISSGALFALAAAISFVIGTQLRISDEGEITVI